MSEKTTQDVAALEGLELDLASEAETRRDSLVKHLQHLVRIPSVSGDEQRITHELHSWATREGFDTRIVTPDLATLAAHRAFTEPASPDYEGRSNVIVELGSGEGPTLALLAHSDVVPVDPMTVWTHDPWGGEVDEKRVYGRGSADCKGGAAVAMVVAETLRDLGVELAGRLQLQFVVEEESGGNGTLSTILAGVTADAMIQLEPTGTSRIVLSNRGAQFFRLRVPGVEGDVAYQHLIANAIDKAVLLINATHAYSDRREATVRHPLYQDRYPTQVPLAICKMTAGAWPSTVPGEAVLEGTIECMPGEDIDAVVDRFEEYLKDVANEDSWLAEHPITFERFGLRLEAAETPSNAHIVTTLLGVGHQALGTRPDLVGGGGSDLRLPVLYADCPTVLYGPAGGMAHSVDEFVTIEELVSCLKVILICVARFLSASLPSEHSQPALNEKVVT